MSFRFLASLNSPPLVAGAGAAVIVGLPFVKVGAASLGALQLANVLAFCTNVAAVSVPGRMDGDQDARMRSGDLNPDASTSLTGTTNSNNIVLASRNKTLVAPAGWAFAIWAPIYVGETLFVASQFYDPTIMGALPELTVPFVCANITQSLWCASFRQSYAEGWKKYVSVAMLGGTAASLSNIPFADLSSSWYLLPVAMHFGWTTAATLVNFNGSLAMANVSERTLISGGHASSILATALGVGVTFSYGLPAYGFTIAWALAACANGMRVTPGDTNSSDALKTGAKVQKMLLSTGSVVSFCAALYTLLV